MADSIGLRIIFITGFACGFVVCCYILMVRNWLADDTLHKESIKQWMPFTHYYVDQENGNDANDGLSISTALATIKQAWLYADVGVGDEICVLGKLDKEELVIG